MGRRKKWKVDLLSGRAAALALLGGLFLGGSVAGCVVAGVLSGGEDGTLLDYVRSCLDGLSSGSTVRFFAVLWELARVPLAALLLGFTALGMVGLPILFAVRGFLLCYAVSVFYRLLGPEGLLCAFVLFGLSALLWMPALFQLGVQGMISSYGLLRRAMGDGRYPLRYDGGCWLRCGLCALALCLCAVLEYFAVPPLLQAIAWAF